MLLEAKNIDFSYTKGQPILKNVSIEIQEGESVALVGPSGCGKSTLSKILSGYLTPDLGSVLFAKKPLPQKGYCPVQLIYQHPEKAVNPKWKMKKILTEGWNPDKSFLDKMGIKQEWLSRYPTELSGGELQRFAIARAMGPETKFIIADEMTTMLDVITQAQIWEVIMEIVKERNMGMLVVTHNRALAEKVCGRIVEFGRW